MVEPRVVDASLVRTIRGKVDWQAVVRVARDNPRQWVEVPGSLNKTVVTGLRRGQYQHVDPTEFEFATTQAPGEPRGRSIIYVRTLT